MLYNRKVINDYPNNYNLESCCSLIFEDADIYQVECIKVRNEKIIYVL